MSSPSLKPELPRLSTADLARRRSHIVLVDAHGPPYFANAHIPGAVNIPPHDVMGLATARIGDLREPVVVYGASGSSNAKIVADQLLAMGFYDVSLYEDGLEGWIAAGLPTEAVEVDDEPGGGALQQSPNKIPISAAHGVGMRSDAPAEMTPRPTPSRTAVAPRGSTTDAVPEQATDHTLKGELDGLIRFVTTALPVGWVLLSIPLIVDLPVEPFVLGTLFLGLVLPAVLLTRRNPGTSVRDLLRDTLRLPRPRWVLLPAALVIPVGTAAVGATLGVGTSLSGSFLISLALANVLASLLIVNLWEEMAWAGFVQRRAMTRWGYARGSVITALLFTGIHLPLSLYGAEDASDVAFNVSVMIASGIGMRLIIGALDSWGGGSILALGLLHATFNASSELIDADADWIRYVVTFTLGVGVLGLVTATDASARASRWRVAAQGQPGDRR